MVPKESVDALLQHLDMRSIRVRGARIKDLPLKDEGDQRLVEAAVEGQATYLVTADRELLRYRGYVWGDRVHHPDRTPEAPTVLAAHRGGGSGDTMFP